MNMDTYTGVINQDIRSATTSYHTNNQCSLNDATQSRTSMNTESSLPASCECLPVHDLIGANVNIQVNQVIIKTHEHRISSFAHLNKLIKKARIANPQSNSFTITITGGNGLVSDLLNTFKLLDIPSVEKTKKFDLEALISAARVADKYGHPALYTSCTNRLVDLSINLNPMERIRIAHALDFNWWEYCACQELAKREEMITKEEALVLGIDAYWHISTSRETRQKQNRKSFYRWGADTLYDMFYPKSTFRVSSGNGQQSTSTWGWLFYLLVVVVWYLAPEFEDGRNTSTQKNAGAQAKRI